MAIIKDDSINQIPLFQLPRQQETVETPVQQGRKTDEPAEPKRSAEPKRPGGKSGKAEQRVGKGKSKPGPGTRMQALHVGPVPKGDVRLTANIRQELHLRLKIAAATRRTTIGDLIEELVEQYL